MSDNIDRLSEAIRRVDGDHTLGAGALAEALADAGCRMLDLPEGEAMTHMTPEQARKYLKRYADEEIPDRIAHRALETLAYRDSDPAWVHAAVAEIVRLKQAIARLRDTYAAPEDPGDDYDRGAEAAYQIAARDLTRILEGKHDPRI